MRQLPAPADSATDDAKREACEASGLVLQSVSGCFGWLHVTGCYLLQGNHLMHLCIMRHAILSISSG